MSRSFHALALVAALAHEASANKVDGRLELPPSPDRPPVIAKGFLDRVENPLKNVPPPSVAPYLVVVLENDAKPESSSEVSWDLVGESFAKPVIVVPAGSQVVIHNQSKTARMLSAAEDPKLIEKVLINPTGPLSLRVAGPKIYSISAKDAPHLRGTLVVANATRIAYVDANGKFDFGDVPEGSYKLRIFYRDKWLDREEPVTVPAKGKPVDVVVKGALVPPPAKK